jgi:adenylylsulfate kinase-like enzyme
MATFSTDRLERLARSIESVMDPEDPTRMIGADLGSIAARIPSSDQVTPGAVVRLSLLNDTLRVAERALEADGKISPAGTRYMGPLVGETHKYLGRVRPTYRELDPGGERGVQVFLEQHAMDEQKFGGSCPSTAWVGLSLCKRATELTGDGHFIDEYRSLLVRMLDDLFGDVAAGSDQNKQAVVRELNRLAPPKHPARDPRDAAYCSPTSPQVFEAVAHGAEVFTPDPFDVEEIHAEARSVFSRLLGRVDDAQFGKLLLVKGVAGSGKTHLMRALRSQVHGEQRGFAAYLQMSTRVANYSRYLLANLVDSWDRPYFGEVVPEPALSCLSDSLCRDLPADLLERLRDGGVPDGELDFAIKRGADELLSLDKYRGAEPDVLRAMLELQRRDPSRRARVLKYLRCEPLSMSDSRLLGGITTLEGEAAPTRMLAELGRLVTATGNGAFVLLVDQLEDLYNLDEASTRFRSALEALRQVADHVPSSVIVVACLDEFYAEMRSALSRQLLDRLERDPDPVLLTANRSLAEIEALIAPRLAFLFERQHVQVRDDQPLFPFVHADLEALVNQRTREVLEWCRAHHEASIRAGGLVIFPPRPGTEQPPPSEPTLTLEQAYNDHAANSHVAPRDEADMVSLIAWALEHMCREVSGLPRVQTHVDGTYVEVRVGEAKLGLALCDRSPASGALGKQIDALRRLAAASGAKPIMLRSSEYPHSGKSEVAEKLKQLLAEGGRRVLITDAEWRRILALKLFLATREDSPDVDEWLSQERPLSGLSAVRDILELDSRAQRRLEWSMLHGLPASSRRSSVPPGVRPSLPPPPVVYRLSRPPIAAGAEVELGKTRTLEPSPVLTSAGRFASHAALVGNTGSGKSRFALAIVQRLLEHGVPALLLDHGGELASYASQAQARASGSTEASALEKALLDVIDVCVFTPGSAHGRALNMPVVPSGLDQLAAHERGSVARHAAAALGALMGYGRAKTDQTRLGILGKAIELVGRRSGSGEGGLGIRELVDVLDAEDPDLVAALGRLDTRHFRALIEHLETVRLRYDALFGSDGERLSPELLFGVGAYGRPGRTRLSIVETRFIGERRAVDYWVARLFGELNFFARQKQESALSALVFLDGAEHYLPAQGKPAAKEPLVELLERGRSAGIGVLLASDDPAELDYRCRDNIHTWFAGRVLERAALERMRPLLGDCRVNVGVKLPHAKPGEFFKLEDDDAVELKAAAPLWDPAPAADDELLRIARQTRLG